MNSITLQLRAGKDLQNGKFRDGKTVFASVFALHHIYVPPSDENPDPSEKTLPINVKFGPKTAPLAALTIKTGVPFVVSGRLDFYKDPNTEREWFSIWADDLMIGSQPVDNQKPEETDPVAGDTTEYILNK